MEGLVGWFRMSPRDPLEGVEIEVFVKWFPLSPRFSK